MPGDPPPSARATLIVNADDFGLSPGVNAAVRDGFRHGVLTSASLMANAPFFDEAVHVALASPGLGVGAHLNLVRGRPLSRPEETPALVDRDGRFRPFRLRRLTPAFLRDAEREYRRQLERILAAGLVPTHIDFEKHHAWQGGLYALACRVAASLGVRAVRTLREPVAWAVRRLGWPGARRVALAAALRCGVTLGGGKAWTGMRRPDRLLGGTHIGCFDETAWLRLAAAIPPGVSELMLHPSHPAHAGDVPSGMGAGWLTGRENEFRALTSERVRTALTAAGVALASYRVLTNGGTDADA